jgi:hypothetical protein
VLRKRDWREGVDGDSSFVWLRERPTGCMSERMDGEPFDLGPGRWRQRAKAKRMAWLVRCTWQRQQTPAQLREEMDAVVGADSISRGGK